MRSPVFVAELTAAIADRTPVDWEAARRRLGSGEGARWLDPLEVLARVAGSGDRDAPAPTAWRPRHRLGVAATALLALCCVLAGLAAVGAITRPAPGVQPFPALWSALAGAAFLVVGLHLISGGRRDPRASHLGMCYVTLSTAFAGRFLSGFGWYGQSIVAHLHPDAFAPFFLWQFAGRFPRTEWFGSFDLTARRMSPIAGVTGVVLFVANALLPLAAGGALEGWLFPLQRGAYGIGYWGAITVLSLPVLLVLPARSRRARPEERERSRVFLGGLVLGLAPILVEMALEVVSPAWEEWALRPANLAVLGPLQLAFLSLAPVTTAYAVVSDRVLDVRLAIHRTARFLIARTTIAAVSLLPLALLVRGLRELRHLPLGDVLVSPEMARLAAIVGAGVVLWGLAPRVSRWLDRAFFRDMPHPTSLISEAVDAISVSRSAEEALQNLARCLRDRLRLSGAHALLPGTAGALRPIDAGTPPWPARSALGELVELGDPVRIEPERPGSVFAWLPPEEQDWILEAHAGLLLPLSPMPGSHHGLVVLGEKLSQQGFSEEDVAALRSVGRATGLALGRHAAAPAAPNSPQNEAPARLCARCGRVSEAERLRCPCGEGTEATVVPALLGGRVRILRLLGKGGMGVVFEGRDEELERGVAVKALPKASPAACQALRREARAMARVSHPALATIYGVETWRYTPILLVELLEGGTVADRLRNGQRTEWPAVAELGVRLARGLAALHGAGLLHRDVKPSNIGLTAGGEPKLLDLGVAEMFESMGDAGAQDRRLAGTLAYLPPEAFRGEPPGPLFDVWGLSVTLVEAAAGAHPFRQRLERAASPDEALEALAAPSLPRGIAPRVKAFSEAALGLAGGPRPRSAGELEALLAMS
jgi:hypothetical protein